MRRGLVIVSVLLSVALFVTGCDFFRVLAGRPTSKDIEAKRGRIEAQALRQAQEPGDVQEDTVATAASEVTGPSAGSGQAPSASSGTGKASSGTEAAPSTSSRTREKKRFYVIMGAFSSRENAERYAKRIKDYGYEPEYFGFTEGRTAVGIGGTDDPEEAKAFMKELKGQDFCPGGVWILDRKRK